jgi:peptidoglycan/LPS O-acetylase OafA/YrhL
MVRAARRTQAVFDFMKTSALNMSALPLFRFVAASIVVFFHFGQKIEWFPQVPEILKAGSLMVTFFFVLSGFVLFLGYELREFNSRSYWIRRCVRILPFYYLSLLMSVWLWSLEGRHLKTADLVLNFFVCNRGSPTPFLLILPAGLCRT